MHRTRLHSSSLAACAGTALLCCGLVASCDDSAAQEHAAAREPIAAAPDGSGQEEPPPERIEVPPPPLSDDIFPCSDCHDPELLPTRTERRPMRVTHQEIVLEHDTEHRWCLDCHDADDRDKLRLASGALIDFEESYMLCGQCHGDKYRDWRAGVHGRRSGNWDGEKTYLLCVHCHDSHAPKFQPLEPLPPPIPPVRTR